MLIREKTTGFVDIYLFIYLFIYLISIYLFIYLFASKEGEGDTYK